jgi:cytochrome P450
VTGAWIYLIAIAGKRAQTIHRLHQKYGPVVRIAPNELCFMSIESLKAIYGQSSDFPKAPLYDNFGRRSVLSMRDINEHKELRKRLSPAFSPAHLNELEPLILDKVRNLIAAVDRHLDGPMDMWHFFRMFALDVSGACCGPS